MPPAKTLTIHSLWALAVAGAWWLGRDSVSNSTPAEGMKNHALEGVAMRKGEGHLSGPPIPAPLVRGIAETAEWMRQWSGPDGRVSPERMAAALEAALSDGNPVRQMQYFSQLLAVLTPENAAAGADALRRHVSPLSKDWLKALAAVWGELDGTGAMAELSKDGIRSVAAQQAAFSGWTFKDPAAAQAWLKAYTPPKGAPADVVEAFQSALVRGLGRNDPDAAVGYIKGLGENQDHLIKVLTADRFRYGVSATAEWAAQLPDESLRRSALETVARRYMQVDPVAGAAWGTEIATGPDSREAVARVADRMAESDVQAAFAWTAKLPPGPGQEEAFQQVFSEWARQDPGASSEMLQQMPAGRERDNAVHAFSRILVEESPRDAIIWASNISDPAMRLDTQVDVARQWNQADPAAAGAWVAANLNGADRARALAVPND